MSKKIEELLSLRRNLFVLVSALYKDMDWYKRLRSSVLFVHEYALYWQKANLAAADLVSAKGRLMAASREINSLLDKGVME